MKLSYDFKNLRGDVIGGVTVAIVALPLAIAFGISSMPGSGMGAAAGLYGAIFAGFFATAFGATNGLINGPTAAMIVVLATAFTQMGLSGFLLSMMAASLMQIILGMFRLGKYISYIPRPVIAGFTNGIGVTIFISKLADFKTNPVLAMIMIAVLLIPFIAGVFKNKACGYIARFFKYVPASLLGLIVCVLLARAFFPSAAHISGIPAGLPSLKLPGFADVDWLLVMKNSVVLCLLASIESLLSAVVVDEMLDNRSNPDQELVGQGIGNFISVLFGGLIGTGAIVRSAVNVGSGGRTKLSGILHALILFLITVKFGYLAEMIPIAALAGILMVTAVRMINFKSFQMLKYVPKSDAFVMLATMVITVAEDLMVAVVVGTVLSALLFTIKMSKHSKIRRHEKAAAEIEMITVPGPLFFGCIREISQNIRGSSARVVLLNMSRASVVDETAMAALFDLKKKMQADGRTLILTRLTAGAKLSFYKMHRGEQLEQFIFDDSSQAVAHAERICDLSPGML